MYKILRKTVNIIFKKERKKKKIKKININLNKKRNVRNIFKHI